MEARRDAAQQAGNINATFTRDFRTGRSISLGPGTLPPKGGLGSLPPLPAEYADLPKYEDVINRPWNGLFYYNLRGDTRRFLRNAGLPTILGGMEFFITLGQLKITKV
jgi:hypothetical protein